MRRAKKPVRFVRVDMGYGPAENWCRAKVVESRMVGQLFSDELVENLLVEIPGGERMWVAYWTEEASTNTCAALLLGDWFCYKPEHNVGRKRARLSLTCPTCGNLVMVPYGKAKKEGAMFTCGNLVKQPTEKSTDELPAAI